MNKATNVKKQILASQIAYKRTQNNEVQLEKALAKFFNKLKKEVLNALDEYWKDYQMLQGHIDLITAPVHEAHKEYYELLALYVKREYRLGSAEAKRLVRLANSKQRVAGKSMRMPVRAIIKKDNDLFGTLPSAEERLLNRTFTASERTLSRVDSQINQIITDGYRSGKGINDVANSLNQRFDQLTSWESKRIARTEIHNSHNTAVMDTYKELDVEYTMWITAHDERVRGLKKGDRANHVKLDGEIIPMGETYSNGLKYPGDTDGPLVEWINCRCSNAPYVIPYGYMAPSFTPFKEADLIKVDTKPITTEPEPVETPIDTSQMSIKEIAEHYNCDYEMVDLQIGKYAKPKTFHKITENFEDGRKLSILFEKETLKSYDRVPVNEIIDEIFKVPKVCRNETSQIWFKNNSDGICKRVNKNGIDRIGKNVGGYNTVEYDHRIVINSKFFKTQKKGSEAEWLYNNDGDGGSSSWKKTLHHEFIHSIDYTKTNGGNRRSYNDEKWTEAQRLERWFTPYANTETTEAYAEHGGYYSYMKANPQDHHLVTKIRNNNYEERKITFEEYVKLYPKHVEYFEETLYSNKITLENKEAQIKLRIRELENKISQIEIHIARLENSDPKSLIKQYQQYKDEMLQQMIEFKKQGQYDLIPIAKAEYEMYKDKIEELKKADPAKQIKENKKKLSEYKSELQRLKRRLNNVN